MIKVVASRTHVHAFIWKCDLIDTRTKEIMAAASGSQRTLDGRVLNQANARHHADLQLGSLDLVAPT